MTMVHKLKLDIMGMFSLGGTISNILRLTSRPACIQIIKPNNLSINKLTLCMCHVNTFTCKLYNETIISDFVHALCLITHSQ